MQRFLSTASLSILTAIAIVVYSSDYSTPIAKGIAAAPSANPWSGLRAQAWVGIDNDETATPMSIGSGLGEELGATGKNDLLALAPYQFSNCNVGLLSHNPLLDQ